MSAIAENLKRVQDRIANAANRSGRSADAVTLIVVTKTWSADVVQQVVDAGQGFWARAACKRPNTRSKR